jgi:hypothetical protein
MAGPQKLKLTNRKWLLLWLCYVLIFCYSASVNTLFVSERFLQELIS